MRRATSEPRERKPVEREPAILEVCRGGCCVSSLGGNLAEEKMARADKLAVACREAILDVGEGRSNSLSFVVDRQKVVVVPGRCLQYCELAPVLYLKQDGREEYVGASSVEDVVTAVRNFLNRG